MNVKEERSLRLQDSLTQKRTYAMAPKVFKIPDGKGGIIYQIQTPDGQWHDTDKDGNLIEKPVPSQEDETPVPLDDPKGSKKKAKHIASPKDRPVVNFTLHFPAEDYKELSDYIHWRCIFKEECTKAGFLMGLAMDIVREDRDYREFRKKNG